MAALLLSALSAATPPNVLVTGASGGTGVLLYHQLKADSRVGSVSALVHGDGDDKSKAKASRALGCTACNASDGVFFGDVTEPATLDAAMKGVNTLAIAVGSPFTANKTLQKAIEFTGVENQVAALAASDGALSEKRVIFCSSMATTNPHPSPFEGGPVLFWKLNAEAFLGSAGIGNTIVKPCGIEGTYGRGGKELTVGHDDALRIAGAISRADLAAVMVEAVVQRPTQLRFDLCVGDGPPTTDLSALLKTAQWPWGKRMQMHGTRVAQAERLQ